MDAGICLTNRLKESDSGQFAQIARTLARNTLRMLGADALAFTDQFIDLAQQPVAVWLDDDGEDGDIFRQVVCFPVTGVSREGLVQGIAGFAPHVLVELSNGLLLAFRINSGCDGRFSPVALLRSLLPLLERLPQGPTVWPVLQRTIEMMTRRRLQLLDFPLLADTTDFWKEHFAKGADDFANRLFKGLPRPTGPQRRLAQQALIEIQSAHYQNALNAFLERLDGDIVRALHATGLMPRVSAYNEYQQSQPQAARYRLQAAEVAPLLSYLLSADHHLSERLRRLVDSGQPLWPALADTVGVPVEAVRWLRGKTINDVGDVWAGRMQALLQSLAQLAPEKRPKTPEEWTAYTDFALVLEQISGAKCCKSWLQGLARLGWIEARNKFAACQATPADLQDIRDLIDEVTGAVAGELLPHVALLYRYQQEQDESWQVVRDAVAALFLEYSVIKQVRTSLRWHQLQLVRDDPATDETEGEIQEEGETTRLDRWPAPLDVPLAIGGLQAHFLTTSAELRDEGWRMEHCVGGYDQHCLFSGSNIVSFRTRDGRSVSTAELRLVSKNQRLSFDVVQHRARQNGIPCAEAEKALQVLLAHLASAALQPRLQQMLEALVQRQQRSEYRQQWLCETPRSPRRLRALKAALKLHAGYERFLDAGRTALLG